MVAATRELNHFYSAARSYPNVKCTWCERTDDVCYIVWPVAKRRTWTLFYCPEHRERAVKKYGSTGPDE